VRRIKKYAIARALAFIAANASRDESGPLPRSTGMNKAMDTPEVTLIVFYLFSALRIGAYLPRIIRVANDTEGAKAISYTTWSVWIGANGSTAAYAVVIAPSMTLVLVSLVKALGCACVVILTMWKRRQFTQPGGA
jgi:hypothetical protein